MFDKQTRLIIKKWFVRFVGRNDGIKRNSKGRIKEAIIPIAHVQR